jgi:hypothetical protein
VTATPPAYVPAGGSGSAYCQPPAHDVIGFYPPSSGSPPGYPLAASAGEGVPGYPSAPSSGDRPQ